jgi:exopolyphosphatase/guanosine-5'-triphosphate,3'-diphosphate pyrophosphatase
VAIVPRWEWRTFGPSFGAAEEGLSRLASGGEAVESDERYLLANDDANVKVRDGLMDIKLLREVDDNGLERWEPVLKEGFPLSAEDVGRVLEALGLSTPAELRSAYELEELLEEFVRPSDAVDEVAIHKRRTRFRVGGCAAELTDVTAGDRSTRTVAVESEDADAVVRAVREIGLDGYVNTSYSRGLRALLDDVPPRYAVIDVGTNSVKFHVGERGPSGSWSAPDDRAEVTRLGEHLGETGVISDDAVTRTAEAIAGMVEEARGLGVLAVAAVGTAWMRSAGNTDDVVRAVRERAGVTIEMLPGDEEARLAYLAVRAGLGDVEGSLVVFDTGGGSSQFTFGEGEDVLEQFSVDVGAARFTERFGLDREVESNDLQEAIDEISADLSRLDDRQSPDALVGMGGAITNMTAVMLELETYDPDRVQGATLDRDEVDRQIERYRSTDADARRAIVGLQPKRAEVILAGACIVRTVMEKLAQTSLTVSDRGLRHGVLAERFEAGGRAAGSPASDR